MNLDDAVSATCTITKGDLPIDVWWTLIDEYNGFERNLSTNDGVMITRASQKTTILNIDAVKARHRGNYTCYAKNKAGISRHSAFLLVNGNEKFLSQILQNLDFSTEIFAINFDISMILTNNYFNSSTSNKSVHVWRRRSQL